MRWLGSFLRYAAGLRLAPYVPVPHTVAARMLTLAKLRPGEAVADLGCGDGRLLRLAVSEQFGAASAVGYELDESLVQQARATSAGDPRVEVKHEDALHAELAGCDVVTLYLTERGNASVLPLLRDTLKPNARVVSYVWGMGPELPATSTATAVGPGVVVQVPNILCWGRDDLLHGAARADVASAGCGTSGTDG